MSIPVEHEVTISNTDGESAWIPINRWGSSVMRIDAKITGTPTFSLVGTQDNILRVTPPASAVELEVAGWTDLTDAQIATQDIVYRALKLKVTAGTGSVTLRFQSEGSC